MKSYTKVLWGILIMALGILIGINALGIADVDIFFDGWWTLFIIIPSLVGLLSDEDKKGSLVGLIIGVVLFLASNDVINFGTIIKLLFPCILVFIGVGIIWDEVYGEKKNKKVKKASFTDTNTYSAVFRETNSKKNSEFKEATVDAVFGSVKLDLSEAKIEDTANIKISAIFGDVKVILPEGVVVKTHETKIFGGVNNSMKEPEKKSKKEKIVYVDAFSLFGGINLK